MKQGRAQEFGKMEFPQIGLAFRTHPTALPQACTLIGAAAMPEIDGNRQHTRRAEPIGACETASDVGTVPRDDAGWNWSSKISWLGSGRGLPHPRKVDCERMSSCLTLG